MFTFLMRVQKLIPHSKNEGMSLDYFSLTGEGVVAIAFLSLLLESSQVSHCMGGSKAHSLM